MAGNLEVELVSRVDERAQYLLILALDRQKLNLLSLHTRTCNKFT